MFFKFYHSCLYPVNTSRLTSLFKKELLKWQLETDGDEQNDVKK